MPLRGVEILKKRDALFKIVRNAFGIFPVYWDFEFGSFAEPGNAICFDFDNEALRSIGAAATDGQRDLFGKLKRLESNGGHRDALREKREMKQQSARETQKDIEVCSNVPSVIPCRAEVTMRMNKSFRTRWPIWDTLAKPHRPLEPKSEHRS